MQPPRRTVVMFTVFTINTVPEPWMSAPNVSIHSLDSNEPVIRKMTE